MTNISATVGVVTEYGIRTPDGEIHWGEFTPPGSHSESCTIDPAQSELVGLARDLARWARDSHLDVDAVLSGYALVDRQVTTVHTEPTLVDNLRQYTGIDATTPLPAPRPTSPF